MSDKTLKVGKTGRKADQTGLVRDLDSLRHSLTAARADMVAAATAGMMDPSSEAAVALAGQIAAGLRALSSDLFELSLRTGGISRMCAPEHWREVSNLGIWQRNWTRQRAEGIDALGTLSIDSGDEPAIVARFQVFGEGASPRERRFPILMNADPYASVFEAAGWVEGWVAALVEGGKL